MPAWHQLGPTERAGRASSVGSYSPLPRLQQTTRACFRELCYLHKGPRLDTDMDTDKTRQDTDGKTKARLAAGVAARPADADGGSGGGQTAGPYPPAGAGKKRGRGRAKTSLATSKQNCTHAREQPRHRLTNSPGSTSLRHVGLYGGYPEASNGWRAAAAKDTKAEESRADMGPVAAADCGPWREQGFRRFMQFPEAPYSNFPNF